jgi:hypothetical protein
MSDRYLSPSLVAVGLALLAACKPSAPPANEVRAAAAPLVDTLVTTGHGQFFGPNGEIVEPTPRLMEAAQRHHIAALRARANPARVAEIEQSIDALVDDEFLARALLIDWLAQTVQPDDLAQVTAMNNAIRWRYVTQIQRDPVMPRGGEWWKGLEPEVARQLDVRGIPASQATSASGQDYLVECRQNDVPVPPPMFSAGWENRGVLERSFLFATGSRAELWSYVSSNPAGVCLALPRYAVEGGNVSDIAEPLGIICLGTESGKACFFDNPSGQGFPRGEPVPMLEFLGGSALASNGQGTCTDCHAGENPFVVHPQDPAYAGLSVSLLPNGWHEPLVDESWPQNPGPTHLLDAIPSPGRCTSCHRLGGAGRFPQLSTELPGYCAAVLENAIGPGGTMPPEGTSPPKSAFASHIERLRAACQTPPSTGEDVEVDIPDDPDFISPPTVIDPLYQCATKVAVRGAILDASLSLFVNGVLIDSMVARDPNQVDFDVPALVVNDVVTTRQEYGGALSAASAPVVVRDHRLDFPDGLPAPAIEPSLVYECAEVISVRHVPGATITVLSNGTDPTTGSGSTDWTLVSPAKRPFVVGDSYTARQALCTDTSGISPPVTAVAEPATIPAPTFDPPATYAGQELVTIESLVNGSRTAIGKEPSPSQPLASFTTSISRRPDYDLATAFGGPLSAGDVLLANQALCTTSARTPSLVGECAALPAPRVDHPVVGDTFILVTESVPGARIRIYDAADDELGDGSGTIIRLDRAITSSDTLTVVQQVGSCTSSEGYRISFGGS